MHVHIELNTSNTLFLGWHPFDVPAPAAGDECTCYEFLDGKQPLVERRSGCHQCWRLLDQDSFGHVMQLDVFHRSGEPDLLVGVGHVQMVIRQRAGFGCPDELVKSLILVDACPLHQASFVD